MLASRGNEEWRRAIRDPGGVNAMEIRKGLISQAKASDPVAFEALCLREFRVILKMDSIDVGDVGAVTGETDALARRSAQGREAETR